MLLEYPRDKIAGRDLCWKLLLNVVCWRAMDRVAAAKERIVGASGVNCSMTEQVADEIASVRGGERQHLVSSLSGCRVRIQLEIMRR